MLPAKTMSYMPELPQPVNIRIVFGAAKALGHSLHLA
jgi:hypothetical protein